MNTKLMEAYRKALISLLIDMFDGIDKGKSPYDATPLVEKLTKIMSDSGLEELDDEKIDHEVAIDYIGWDIAEFCTQYAKAVLDRDGLTQCLIHLDLLLLFEIGARQSHKASHKRRSEDKGNSWAWLENMTTFDRMEEILLDREHWSLGGVYWPWVHLCSESCRGWTTVEVTFSQGHKDIPAANASRAAESFMKFICKIAYDYMNEEDFTFYLCNIEHCINIMFKDEMNYYNKRPC